jgi:hypothetical protein
LAVSATPVAPAVPLMVSVVLGRDANKSVVAVVYFLEGSRATTSGQHPRSCPFARRVGVSAVIGTYSAKCACARMAQRRAAFPPSPKPIRFLRRGRTTCRLSAA